MVSSAEASARRVWSSITRAESRVIPVKHSSRLSSSSWAISSLIRSGLTITRSVNSMKLNPPKVAAYWSCMPPVMPRSSRSMA
jgi:hypothetical protein